MRGQGGRERRGGEHSPRGPEAGGQGVGNRGFGPWLLGAQRHQQGVGVFCPPSPFRAEAGIRFSCNVCLDLGSR